MPTQIFVNLPVKNLPASMEFFKTLGFSFNPQFTNESGACLVIGDTIYAMLLKEEFFKTFTPRQIADTSQVAETMLALSMESREKVDELANKAIAAGGKIHREPQDLGWMYTQCIEDLDGHIWELFFMDAARAPQS